MASFAVPVLQAAVYANAAGYIYNPKPYDNRGRAALEQTDQALRYLSESEAMQTVRQAVNDIFSRLLKSMRPAKKGLLNREAGDQDAEPGARAQGKGSQTQKSLDSLGKDQSGVENIESDGDTKEPSRMSGVSPECPTAVWPNVHYHEPSNLYGLIKPYELAVPSKSELDKIFGSIPKLRVRRHEEIQRRIQRYRHGGISHRQEMSEKKKGKKTVHFALDTKLSSAPSRPSREEKLLLPLAPDDTALTQLSASLALGDGSLFTHPNDFDEVELIRRLPAQMKNGAGGLAWCKGRTEHGLYLLETPVRRLLLDLRAGLCYDGQSGTVMDVNNVMGFVLWGRARVEETLGEFGWKRDLEGIGK